MPGFPASSAAALSGRPCRCPEARPFPAPARPEVLHDVAQAEDADQAGAFGDHQMTAPRVRHQRHGLLQGRFRRNAFQAGGRHAGNHPATGLRAVVGQGTHDVLFGNDADRGIVLHHHQRSDPVRAHLVGSGTDGVFGVNGDDSFFLGLQEFADVHSCFLVQVTEVKKVCSSDTPPPREQTFQRTSGARACPGRCIGRRRTATRTRWVQPRNPCLGQIDSTTATIGHYRHR